MFCLQVRQFGCGLTMCEAELKVSYQQAFVGLWHSALFDDGVL